MAETDLTRIAYKALQQGKGLAGLAHKQISSKLMEFVAPEAMPGTKPMSSEVLNDLRRSIEDLENVDWQEAEQGIYPKSQLFDTPWLEWAARYPLIWLDLPSTWQRRKSKETRNIPKQIDPEAYPDYYLQNFHYQTDGYLSDHSAGLYDIQVEILFNGTADSMRGRIIAPLKRGLKRFSDRPQGKLKVLDVATGTGRTLKQIRSALKDVELLGIDLSGSYLRQASQYLNVKGNKFTELIRGNAEKMPFEDESLQGITCVFLLHELPPKARQNVLNECWRVLEPGGILILADSIQTEDSPQFESILNDFHKVFHEPYYKNYIDDNIKAKLMKSGFQAITSQSHFMTKVWSANKSI